ncbi:MAG: ABC transporter ATP-binding protein [Betaproteobacteria bacterium]|nr:ABC transporter ATP-binding protein [Betaproteobacteria bacterium]
MTSQPAVEIIDVSKQFGNTSVLNRISLEVRKGEFLSLLGPSGCGKTTLLRIIAGFEHQSSGEVRIEGQDVSGVPPFARSTNMIFQHLALFPHMTVFENIAFGLRMKKADQGTISRRVEQALALVQLQGYEQRLPEQLSGGQRQRIAMARALVNDPSVLLLDEPLGALDLQLRLQLQVELRQLHRSLGSTFIFVTHDQTEAMTMSDRIAVFENGQIVQLGTPQEIYETPRTRFVARFVGHANLLDGKITSIDTPDRCMVELPGGVAAVQARPAPGAKAGQSVTVVLRYERIHLREPQSQNSASSDNEVAVSVQELIYMGGFLRVRVQTTAGLSLVVDTAASDTARRWAIGTQLVANWATADARALTD